MVPAGKPGLPAVEVASILLAGKPAAVAGSLTSTFQAVGFVAAARAAS